MQPLLLLPETLGRESKLDKTLPAAVLPVPSSAFSSFLTFSIARIDSGMPGSEQGGKAPEVEEKRLCASSVPPGDMEKDKGTK